MAERSTVFVSNGISPTNSECTNGRTGYISFALQSGSSLPPAGSVLKSVKFSFTDVNVYTSSSPRLETAYGNIPFASGSGAKSTSMTSPSSAILNFGGGSLDFTVQSAREAGKNVLNIRTGCSVTMTITYEVRTASTGSLSPTSGMQGGTIKLSFTAADNSFTHRVLWYRDSSHQTTVELAAGVTSCELTVPTSWPVGAATCTLTTYLSGSQIGSAQTYNWTVVVDGTKTFPTGGKVTPALVQSSKVPSSWGVYVQGYSQCKLTLSGHAAGTSASIKAIDLAVGSQKQSGTSATFTTQPLSETGNIACTGKVTNSFGNSTDSTSSSITVYPYESPKVPSIVAYRCLSNGVANDYGTYIAVTASAEISDVNGKNSVKTFQVQFAAANSTSWGTAYNLTSGQKLLINAGLKTDGTIYQVRVTLIDQIQNLSSTSTTKTALVLTSECILFFKDGGLNVSVGTQGSRDNAVEINPAWHIWWGDEELTGVTPVSRGGTGGSSAAAARNNLGLGNTDGALPIANGGTGRTSVPAARNALGLGNTSGALPVANGGTGSTKAEDARTALGITPGNIGAAASSHNHAASSITSGTLAMARLPFKVAYGTVTLSGTSWANISYNSAGFTGIPMVLCTFTDNATTSGINVIKTQSRTTTGCQVCMAGSGGSGSRVVCWLAIGT